MDRVTERRRSRWPQNVPHRKSCSARRSEKDEKRRKVSRKESEVDAAVRGHEMRGNITSVLTIFFLLERKKRTK